MRLFAILALLLVLAGAGAFAGLHSFNHFAEIEREFAGQCEPVRGVPGPEDIQIDSDRNLAFVTSLDRREKDARGAIHIFDLDDPLAADGWRDRTDGAPEAFKPLGLDYFEDGDARRLFVVNEAGNSVELFDVTSEGALVHLETFAERRLNSPNNVVAVGPRSFYVTNDVKPGRNTLLGSLHFLMRTGSGEVLYTDGTIWRAVAGDLRFANGIEVNAAGDRLYVAESAAATVRIYERDQATGALAPVETIKLAASPDNMSLDDADNLWIAARPKPLAVSAFANGRTKAVAPSAVIRISADGEPETIYRDGGDELSAATTAAHLGRKLLIGALKDDKFLICDYPIRPEHSTTTP